MLSYIWFALLLLIVIRPLAVFVGLGGAPSGRIERRIMSWFGIRGIGSVYYLCFGIMHGLPGDIAKTCAAATLAAIAASIPAHGITVSPIMNWYSERYKSDHSTRVATKVPS